MPTPRPLSLVSAVLVASAVASPAIASGFSTDIELVRPTFSPRSTAGTDSPFIGGEGRFDLGMQLQFERDPLRLIEFDEVTGAVVRNRAVNQIGFSWAASDRISVRGSIPLAVHWASETEDLSGDGFGAGDISAGLKYQFYEAKGATLALHGDLAVNLGARGRYMGETQPRTYFGLIGAYEFGPALLMSNLGVQTRAFTDTELDFALGNELVWNSAVVVETPVPDLAVTGEILSRYGLAQIFQGGAETSMEWTAGVQYRINKSFQLDLAAGRGITAGYGTSSYRGIAAIRFQRTPPPPPVEEPDFVVEILDIPEDLLEEDPPLEPIPQPTGEWRQGELARRLDDRIVIRDPIQFEFATARILPASLPTLRQVASLVNTDGRIGHLLIEGHASEEGTYSYNYDLSIRRAKAIFEQLIVLAVHPERMSYRGMGEVVPIAEGSDEASLEKNRRVEFAIIKQYQPGVTAPTYEQPFKWPWSGEAGAAVQPPPVPAARTKPSDLLKDPASQEAGPPPGTSQAPPATPNGAGVAPAQPAPVVQPPATQTPMAPAVPAKPAVQPPATQTPIAPAPVKPAPKPAAPKNDTTTPDSEPDEESDSGIDPNDPFGTGGTTAPKETP
ncbi:MAG: OmpA family protein [Myxococcota bacterium]